MALVTWAFATLTLIKYSHFRLTSDSVEHFFLHLPWLSSMLAVKPHTRIYKLCSILYFIGWQLSTLSLYCLAPFLMNLKNVSFSKSSISVTHSYNHWTCVLQWTAPLWCFPRNVTLTIMMLCDLWLAAAGCCTTGIRGLFISPIRFHNTEDLLIRMVYNGYTVIQHSILSYRRQKWPAIGKISQSKGANRRT